MAPPRPEWCSRVENVQGSFGAPKPLPRREVTDRKDWQKAPARAIVDSNRPRCMDAAVRKISRRRMKAGAGVPPRPPVAAPRRAQSAVSHAPQRHEAPRSKSAGTGVRFAAQPAGRGRRPVRKAMSVPGAVASSVPSRCAGADRGTAAGRDVEIPKGATKRS